MGVALAFLTAALGLNSGHLAVGSGPPNTAVTLPAAILLLPAASRQLPAVEAAQVKLGDEPIDPAKEKAAAVARATAHLSKTLGVDAEKVALDSATPATWPDTALGCPEKDRVYAQVVTSGYKVLLKVDGKTHEVHVAGSRAVTCPR